MVRIPVVTEYPISLHCMYCGTVLGGVWNNAGYISVERCWVCSKPVNPDRETRKKKRAKVKR